MDKEYFDFEALSDPKRWRIIRNRLVCIEKLYRIPQPHYSTVVLPIGNKRYILQYNITASDNAFTVALENNLTILYFTSSPDRVNWY
jgi:hypothetical protein